MIIDFFICLAILFLGFKIMESSIEIKNWKCDLDNKD